MSRHQVYVASAVLLAVLVVRVPGSTVEQSSNPSGFVRSESAGTSEKRDHYPLAWAEIPFKNILANDRLFGKFKVCFLTEQTKGCPKVIMDITRLAPEVLATNCAKCLPAHVERIKEIVNYLCENRRVDLDEIRRIKDPNGAMQSAFNKKYGKTNC
ncbi:ejaculatory bulb-specific protein 3-like [Phymastichus coffea]|uniref:ejaculatory bulb-specific protein 3-like n=1 Tax=Phymastichus coffea TaxID=108790 RepID=UPI00273C3A6D|nr:ejaculatory bulb-specific protein 3-like [Phymastichus coffea]